MTNHLILLVTLLLLPLGALRGAVLSPQTDTTVPAEQGTNTGTAPTPALAPFTPANAARGGWAMQVDTNLPNVLILGDSISIGYTLPVRELLRARANVFRPMRPNGRSPDNCGDTTMGLTNLDRWLGTNHWDVIHFNWGLWDLCYRHPESKSQGNRDKVRGKLSTPPAEYERNLEQLVVRLKATGSRLIWASTTVVPEGEVGRFVGDDVKYNDIAARVMKRNGIPINDLHATTRAFPAAMFTQPGDVHFTPQGYAALATQVVAKVSEVLKKPAKPGEK